MEQASRQESDRLTNPLSIRPATAPTPVQRIAHRADVAPSGGQSCIGRELTITGTIRGEATLESLYIEGAVEGAIELPASRVTVGANGHVKAGIMACDIVVLGEVLGDMSAAHRIDIRAKASVTGNVCAPRVNMEDGADFHGKLTAGVEGAEQNGVRAEMAAVELTTAPLTEPPRALRIPAENRKLRTQSALQTA
jgi:cytoskeletal protein CcmA (bactofilin family)